MMARFDTILMGRKTFEVTQARGGGVSMPGVITYVVSQTLKQEDHPDLTIIAEDIGDAVARLRADSGKAIWLFGGGILFRDPLDLGLVDTIEVAVIPVLLGDGIPLLIPLLPVRSQHSSLRLVASQVYEATGTVMLEYAVQQDVA
jgi:dihydrofolate reductase